MPISIHLLERAYQLIDAGQLQNAELVLDAVVRADPKNIMAWKAYLQICQEYSDLEWLLDRILNNGNLCEKDKAEICSFQKYLVQNLYKRRQNADEPSPRRICRVSSPAQQEAVIFELLEEFEYPERQAEQKKRRKTRQYFKYNIPPFIWQAAGLLTLFYSGVRLLVLGHQFSGIFLMTIFILGGVRWVRNFNAQKPAGPAGLSHAYSLESQTELSIVEKAAPEARGGDKKETASRIRYLDE
jgi:hypothetical protein